MWLRTTGQGLLLQEHGTIRANLDTKLPESVIIWSGLVRRETNGEVRALVSNWSSKRVDIPKRGKIAKWLPMEERAIDMAEEINHMLLLVKEERTEKQSSDEEKEPEDPLWQDDDRLSYNVSNIRPGTPDPSLDEDADTIRRAYQNTLAKLRGTKHINQQKAWLAQAIRLNERLHLEQESEREETHCIPDALSFDIGYGHLSTKELEELKEIIASQASFS